MRWNQDELASSKQTNTSANYSYLDYMQKPIEVYVFIDPLCAECWSLEPYLKKLSVEYGRFFTVRQVISGQISSINNLKLEKQKQMKETWEKTARLTGMSCDGDLWDENPIASPLMPALAIKAAELQGKRAGKIFLRKLQERLFLNKENIADEDILMSCAKEANLDTEEFGNDLHSATAENALQCDIRLLREMDVDYTPSIVFFNQNSDEEGIKISGRYPYEIYEMILKETLKRSPIPSSKPSLEDFLQQYGVVGTKEVSVVYDWTEAKTEKELKKLQIQQVVKRIPAKYGTFWRYNQAEMY